MQAELSQQHSILLAYKVDSPSQISQKRNLCLISNQIGPHLQLIGPKVYSWKDCFS